MSKTKKQKTPQLLQELKVMAIEGEPTRFRVQSESRPQKSYLVELSHEPRDIFCECAHHQMRVVPHNRKVQIERQITCKHAHSALIFLAMQFLKQIDNHTKR